MAIVSTDRELAFNSTDRKHHDSKGRTSGGGGVKVREGTWVVTGSKKLKS